MAVRDLLLLPIAKPFLFAASLSASNSPHDRRIRECLSLCPSPNAGGYITLIGVLTASRKAALNTPVRRAIFEALREAAK